ncbi:MAG TPA: aspartate kinase [Clostridiales bacterium]|nr:aspartate kinase [Clostridiales bacterium]
MNISVEKIGGTSMTRFDTILKNVILNGKRTGRVFVVSAYSGITDLLLDNKKTKEPGVLSLFIQEKDYLSKLDETVERMISLNRKFEILGLDLKASEYFISSRVEIIKRYLNSITHIVKSGYIDQKELYSAAREVISALGESHAAFNSANIINNRGFKALLVDLSGNDDGYNYTIDERIAAAFSGIDLSDQIAIVTGYIKGIEGIMKEFDRGYSEVAFSKIAAFLKADEAIIHKEYHLSSADPKIVGEANSRPILFTSYSVADQLADIGMEAIHPKTSKILEKNNINLRVKNSFEPDHPGTFISSCFKSAEKAVEIIAGCERIMLFEIYDSMMVGQYGYDLGIMKILAEHKISYVFKSTSANTITFAVHEKDFTHALFKDLENRYEKIELVPSSLVNIIGTNISCPGFLYRASRALYENAINIDALGITYSQQSIQLVVGRGSYMKSITVLNDAFFR